MSKMSVSEKAICDQINLAMILCAARFLAPGDRGHFCLSYKWLRVGVSEDDLLWNTNLVPKLYNP